MKYYTILWERSDYGRITLKADSEQEARDRFECGDFEERDLNIKDGQMDLVEIKEVE